MDRIEYAEQKLKLAQEIFVNNDFCEKNMQEYETKSKLLFYELDNVGKEQLHNEVKVICNRIGL